MLCACLSEMKNWFIFAIVKSGTEKKKVKAELIKEPITSFIA